MAFIHGKDTFVSINGVNLSAYSNKTEFKRTRDSHDVTTFGNNVHIYQGGLGDGTATLEGIYDNTAVLVARWNRSSTVPRSSRSSAGQPVPARAARRTPSRCCSPTTPKSHRSRTWCRGRSRCSCPAR
jgi:hypothetical protein